jgi:potassium efflux system protein
MGIENETNEVVISNLDEGDYFGEVSLITGMKRTATVRAMEYCTMAVLDRDSLLSTKENFPSVYLSFRKTIAEYNDPDMMQRKKMLRNVPYFRNLGENVLTELVYLMRQ